MLDEGQSILYNELGSKMILIADGKGGLTGTYTSAVGQAQNEWESTLIDQDVFTPVKPTDKQIKMALQRRAPSHPKQII